MIKKLITLEWKQFYRSSSFKMNIFLKILVGLSALYFIACFLLLGVGMYFILEEEFPGENPLKLICRYVIIFLICDLLLRFFMQKLPVMNIRPFLTFPIKRKTIIHYLIGKTLLSFFNFLPLFFFIPLTVVLIIQGYGYSSLLWLLAMTGFIVMNNLINFLLQKNNIVFYLVVAVFIILFALTWWGFFDIFPYTESFFYAMYEYPFALVLPMILSIILYKVVFRYLRKNFYIDEAIRKKTTDANTMELGFLNRFGKLAIFLKNDVRMIRRNARPKQILWISFIFIFYGVLFFTQKEYQNSPAFLVLASTFITSGFLFSFGQLVPSWDSQYYKLLMSQNISYRKYLESKWWLMVLVTILIFILATPYIYFGINIYLMILSVTIFNIGINSFVTLLGGALNKTPVELNVKKAFGNTQGFNPIQLLIGLPKIVAPMLIFYVPYLIWGHFAGLITLAVLGIVGFLLKDFFLSGIVKIYKKEKYKTIAAFSEKK